MAQLLGTHLSRLVLGASALVGLAACDAITGIDGSGVPETTTYDFSDFTEISVEGTFDVDIDVAEGPPSVAVTVDDNLVEHLDVKVDGTELHIGFERGSYDPDVHPSAVVSVPSLRGLDISGASRAVATGVESNGFALDVSGASHAILDGELETLTVDASGASLVLVTGTSGDVNIDASGASTVELSDFTATRAEVDLSGASSVEIGRVDLIEGELSGASTLTAPEEADGSISSSGASTVNWR